MDDAEIKEAGALLADLLTSTLSPRGGSWDGARQTYIWEHNALCWLTRNRERLGPICAWTAMLLDKGYPAKPFTASDGRREKAGAWWNSSMEPKRDE